MALSALCGLGARFAADPGDLDRALEGDPPRGDPPRDWAPGALRARRDAAPQGPGVPGESGAVPGSGEPRLLRGEALRAREPRPRGTKLKPKWPGDL